MPAQAYTFETMTFCEPCALVNTGIGLLLSGIGLPENMDDAIARMALTQVLQGMEISTPVAVAHDATGICDLCGNAYSPQGSDAA